MPVIIEATLEPGFDAIQDVIYELRRLPVRLMKMQVEPLEGGEKLCLIAELDGELSWYCVAMLERIPGILEVDVRREPPDATLKPLSFL